MAESYEFSRSRADKVLPDVKWVLKQACGWNIEVASEYLDIKEATDVVAGWRHIAVRSRSYKKYFDDYGREFTIRSRRDTGSETELAKINKGFGDYLLYGFLEDREHRWFTIIDLGCFRRATSKFGHDIFSDEMSNNDGTFFRAYRIIDFERRRFPIWLRYGAC